MGGITHSMQFRDYVFPHNPTRITVRREDRTARLFCPGQGAFVQYLGQGVRVVRCEGSFLGDSFAAAAAQLDGFRKRAAGETPGMLFVPGEEPFPAYLEEFAYEAAGDGLIIPYVMVFAEGEAGG